MRWYDAGLLRIKLPSTVKNPYNLEINAGNIFSDEIIGSISKGLSEEETAQIMIDGYIEMISYDDYVAKYKEFFKYLQDENSLPLSYHCSAGKDRTKGLRPCLSCRLSMLIRRRL